MTEQGYLLVADVLGFSAIVRNSGAASIDQRISEWIGLVELAAGRAGIQRFSLLSDTVFAAVPNGTENLIRLVDFGRALLERALEASFPVRGGIAAGDFTWRTQLVYGRAVIAAHRLESNQQWIGIACDADMGDLTTLWDSKRLVCYAPPMKSGPIRIHPVVNWSVPTFPVLMGLIMRSGALRNVEAITWDIGQKLSNTLHFSSYLALLEREGLPGSSYHQQLPMQLADDHLRKRSVDAG